MFENSPLVGIVDSSQRDILLVLKETVEVRVVSVESKLGEEELNVGPDEGTVACQPIRRAPVSTQARDKRVLKSRRRTLCTICSDRSAARLEPAGLPVRILQRLQKRSHKMESVRISREPGEVETNDGVTLLQQLVDEDQALERLDLICQHRLNPDRVPDRHTRPEVPGVDDAL